MPSSPNSPHTRIDQFKRHTVTAALIYANGPVHIGHVAGCYLPADIYVRYLRACHKDVIFVTGTDEHGVPIALQADKQGCTPQQLVDAYYPRIRDSLEKLDISFDCFERTSDPLHYQVAGDFFTHLHEKGYLEARETEQYYDATAKTFLADRYIRGTCPACDYAQAYGDQCEHCGRSLSPQELIRPYSIFGGSLTLRNTTNWYLPMERWQKEMEKYITSKQSYWKKNVYQQCQSWLKEGLQARAMTRDLAWGVPVPLPKADGKVLYVWFDAPIGYISATQKLRPDDWQDYWQRSDTQLVHFIGKDNIVFHCLIFPLMLQLHGSYCLPDNVPANEFLNLEGEKLSTSRNWAVWLGDYLSYFPADVLRYVLCAQLPENKDSDFTWKTFQAMNNNELGAILGNFVHRTLHLIHRYHQGFAPPWTDTHASTLAQAQAHLQAAGKDIEGFSFRTALRSIMSIARLGHRFIAEQAPWEVTDPKQQAAILATAVQLMGVLAVGISPFMPNTAQQLNQLLGFKGGLPPWQAALKNPIVPDGQTLGKPKVLFKPIDNAAINQQINNLKTSTMEQTTPNPAQDSPKDSAQTSSQESPKESFVDIETFGSVALRVGTVLACEPVPKSSKLLQFLIDDGVQQRTILSGIAAYYTPTDLIGTQIVFVANLKPRKMMGILSQGMILCAENSEALRLIVPDEVIDPGTRIT